MSTSEDTLASIAVEIIADDSSLRAGLDSAVSYARGRGEQVGSSFAMGFHSPILDTIGTVRQLQYTLSDAADMAGKLSGVEVAARYERLAMSMTALTGSKEEANQLVDSLQKLSDQTLLDPMQLAGYSRQLIGIGVAAGEVTGDLKAMADANEALTGGDAGKMQQLVTALTRMRGGSSVNPGQFRRLLGTGLNLDEVVAAGTGQHVGAGQGANVLSGMNPRAAYSVFVKGLEAVYKDAAADAANGTLEGISATTRKAFEEAMKPTGDALLPTLEAAGRGLRWVGEELGALNKATGGGLGLGLVAGTGITILRQYGATMWESLIATGRMPATLARLGESQLAVISATNSLNTSLVRLAETLGTTALATTKETVAEEENAAAKIGNARTGGGGFGGLGGGIESFAPFFTMSGKDFSTGFNKLEKLLNIPEKYRTKIDDDKGGSGGNRLADALDDNTDALKAASKAYGLGSRGQHAVSQIEREWVVYHLTRSALTGIG